MDSASTTVAVLWGGSFMFEDIQYTMLDATMHRRMPIVEHVITIHAKLLQALAHLV